MLRLAPLLFVILWSSGFVGAKFGLPYAEPLSFLLVRYLIVIALMLAIALATRAPWPADPRQWLHIGVSGVLVHAIYLGGVFVAIQHGLPAGITALVVGIQPLLTALLAGWLLDERIVARQWLGLGLGLGGVVLVLSGKLPADVPPWPMLIPAIVALLGITVGTLYQKRFCHRFDWRSGSVIQFLPTACVTALAVALTEDFAITWHPEFLFALGWLVLVLSVGAITLLNLLIARGSAVNTSSLFYLTPPTTALIAWGVFGETLNLAAVIGMAVAVAGVWLVAGRAQP